MADLLYIEKINSDDRAAFQNGMVDICAKLGIHPNWLAVVMNSESGMNPKAYNKNGGASGLIQWMPKTAEFYGTTTEALRNMKASEQLPYVYKYFEKYKGKLKGAYDIYLATFFPLAVGKPDDWIFEANKLSKSAVAKGNPAIDMNKDNQITVGEFKQWFGKRIGKQYAIDQNPVVKLYHDVVNDRKKMIGAIVISVVLIAGFSYFTYYLLKKQRVI